MKFHIPFSKNAESSLSVVQIDVRRQIGQISLAYPHIHVDDFEITLLKY